MHHLPHDRMLLVTRHRRTLRSICCQICIHMRIAQMSRCVGVRLIVLSANDMVSYFAGYQVRDHQRWQRRLILERNLWRHGSAKKMFSAPATQCWGWHRMLQTRRAGRQKRHPIGARDDMPLPSISWRAFANTCASVRPRRATGI